MTRPSGYAAEQSRRGFLRACAAALVIWPSSFGHSLRLLRKRPGPHPTPRPGITAANVLTAEQLSSAPHAIPVFDLVREIPDIVDGIRCQCGCADTPGFYSLLSCYESDGMARFCDICQGEARLAHRLHRAGQSLDDIRSAIDARFG